MITRRHAIFAGAAFASLTSPDALLAQKQPATLPDPKKFQKGDFVWPKHPKQIVPYEVGRSENPAAQREAWIRERDAAVANAREQLPYFKPQDIQRLQKMQFEKFYSDYIGHKADESQIHARGNVLYVGHVGIIDIDANGQPWVIEAVLENPDGRKGVFKSPYLQWLTFRPDNWVWHGRLGGVAASDRARIATEAAKQLGKKYDFWNFDLNEDSGFYCSKLVWMATFRSLGIAIDDRPNPKRFFWFSPKQLLNVRRMNVLFKPGEYS